uniref:b(0,+)-type amino acid transporter 1 n=1 Tax=Phallusia mammillata TaxID=59560 RepID=A0A6F9DT31_9ASCI|nr:b(0,+)-type amino acid transporter 1-like [Phallusia mammillata]
MMIWLASGVLSMFGALCYIELGTMIPKSGAEFYVFLEAFGPIPAYLFAWTSSFILKPSTFSLLALTFAEYVLKPLYAGNCGGIPPNAVKLVAATLILLVVLLNCYSSEVSSKVVTVFSVGKSVSLGIIIVGGIVWLAKGHTEHFQDAFSGSPPGVREISLALYQGLYAFGGWDQLNCMVEEVKDPYRTVPRAVVTGMAIVTGLYFLTNVAYLSVMSMDELLSSPAVGVTFAERVLGVGSLVIPVAVAFSVFGTCLAICFATVRIMYVAAREEHFNQVLAMIHVRTLTPAPAVILMGVLSMLMLIPTDFDTLLDFMSFASWSFRCLAVAALILMRYTMPDRHRPFKVPIIIPIIFVLSSAYLIIAPIIDDPQIQYLVATLGVLLGLVFYIPFVHFKKRSLFIRKSVNFNDGQVDLSTFAYFSVCCPMNMRENFFFFCRKVKHKIICN